MGARHERTAGGVALSRIGKPQTEIAGEVGVSKVTVHQWIAGAKRPGPQKRDRLQELYGIDPQRWDELPQRTTASTPSRTTRPANDDGANAEAAGGAFAMARSLQRQAQAQLDELEEAGKEWTPGERVRVMQGLASTINVLAKITGQYELGRRLLALPIWKQIERELFEILKDYPEASDKVAERFEHLETTLTRAS